MAKQLLNPQRTSLDKLGLDAATRKRFDAAGIKDVEGLLATDPAKLAEIVGDRTAAAKLIDAAKKLLSIPARPASVAATETAKAKVAKKKPAKKKPTDDDERTRSPNQTALDAARTTLTATKAGETQLKADRHACRSDCEVCVACSPA